jgi:DNA-binding response OmpR family regulator
MENEQLKKSILVVEDDLSMLNVIVEKLTREGYRILQAKDGEEGYLTAMSDHPDLILLDILMPKMDGLAMMKKLRAENSWGKNVPIIVLTNLNPDDEKINAGIAEDEPAYYLVKSNMSMDDVAEKVKERLARPM